MSGATIHDLIQYTRSGKRSRDDVMRRFDLSPRGFDALISSAEKEGAVVDLSGAAVVSQAPPQSPDSMLALRKKDAELRRIKAERKRLVDELEEARSRVDFMRGVEPALEAQAPKIKRREKRSGLREAAAVALFSDWHVEEIVEPEKVNGLNAYGLEIAEQRIQKWVHGLLHEIDGARSTFHVRDLVLWLGGDLMTGHLHDDNIETTELAPVQTALWLHEKLSQIIDAVLEHGGLDRLHVPCSYGNHGRTTKKPRSATSAEHSREWMLYQLLAKKYADDERVTITAPRSLLIYQPVYDNVIRFLHGNMAGFRYNGGVGGLSIPLNKAVARLNHGRHADFTALGHFHQLHLGLRWMVNGSGIGYAPYALDVTAEYEPPQQGFMMWDARHGPCRQTPIWLDDGRKPETNGILPVADQKWEPKVKINAPNSKRWGKAA